MTTLQSADALRLGSVTPDAVYAGNTKVWPVSTEFNPSTIPGLTVWLDAADYVDGPWPSRAPGGGSMAYLGTPNPTIADKDGRPVVRYRPSQGRHRASGTGVTVEWTLAYVGRWVGPNSGRLITAAYPPYNLLVGFWNGNEDAYYDNGFASNSYHASSTDWILYSGDGTAVPTPLGRIFRDGVLLGTLTTAQGWAGTLNVSGYSAEGADETGDFECAEVLLYDRKLSDAERVQVEDYLRLRYWGPTVDPATAAYMTATGLPGSFEPAVDGLVTGLKSAGLWTKMKAVYPFVGGTEALHKWNLVDPRDLDAAFRLTFMGSGSTHTTALGYRANAQGQQTGSSRFADTHLVPSAVLSTTGQHLAFYGTQDVPAADRAEMGCFNWGGASGRFHIIARYQPTTFYFGMAAADFANVPVAKTTGLFVSTRTAPTLTTAYLNGASISTSAAGFGDLPPVSVYVGAINEFGNRSDIPCGFASIGDGLTAQNVADLYEVVQAYQTALGRAV